MDKEQRLSRRALITSALLGSATIAAGEPVGFRALLEEVARKYRDLQEFYVRTESTFALGDRFAGEPDVFILAAKPPEIRYEVSGTHYPGGMVFWTDSRIVRRYEGRYRHLYEAPVDAVDARLSVLPGLAKAQRIMCSRFGSLNLAESASKKIGTGVVRVGDSKVACKRIVVLAPPLMAKNGTEEIWISDASGYVVRSIIRELEGPATSERITTWTEFRTTLRSDSEVHFVPPADVVASPNIR